MGRFAQTTIAESISFEHIQLDEQYQALCELVDYQQQLKNNPSMESIEKIQSALYFNIHIDHQQLVSTESGFELTPEISLEGSIVDGIKKVIKGIIEAIKKVFNWLFNIFSFKKVKEQVEVCKTAQKDADKIFSKAPEKATQSESAKSDDKPNASVKSFRELTPKPKEQSKPKPQPKASVPKYSLEITRRNSFPVNFNTHGYYIVDQFANLIFGLLKQPIVFDFLNEEETSIRDRMQTIGDLVRKFGVRARSLQGTKDDISKMPKGLYIDAKTEIASDGVFKMSTTPGEHGKMIITKKQFVDLAAESERLGKTILGFQPSMNKLNKERKEALDELEEALKTVDEETKGTKDYKAGMLMVNWWIHTVKQTSLFLNVLNGIQTDVHSMILEVNH